MDCWCLEKKHQRYKAMLADSLQSLWEEGSGALSRQICGRMLHSTVVDLAVLRVGAAALTGKIHGEEAVFQLTGARAKVAATVEVGSLTIKQFEVILWETVGATYAGKVQRSTGTSSSSTSVSSSNPPRFPSPKSFTAMGRSGHSSWIRWKPLLTLLGGLKMVQVSLACYEGKHAARLCAPACLFMFAVVPLVLLWFRWLHGGSAQHFRSCSSPSKLDAGCTSAQIGTKDNSLGLFSSKAFKSLEKKQGPASKVNFFFKKNGAISYGSYNLAK